MKRPVTKICSKCGCMFTVWEGGFRPAKYDPAPLCNECQTKELKDVIDKIRGK